jgi:hypothetical protein
MGDQKKDKQNPGLTDEEQKRDIQSRGGAAEKARPAV